MKTLIFLISMFTVSGYSATYIPEKGFNKYNYRALKAPKNIKGFRIKSSLNDLRLKVLLSKNKTYAESMTQIEKQEVFTEVKATLDNMVSHLLASGKVEKSEAEIKKALVASAEGQIVNISIKHEFGETEHNRNTATKDLDSFLASLEPYLLGNLDFTFGHPDNPGIGLLTKSIEIKGHVPQYGASDITTGPTLLEPTQIAIDVMARTRAIVALISKITMERPNLKIAIQAGNANLLSN